MKYKLIKCKKENFAKEIEKQEGELWEPIWLTYKEYEKDWAIYSSVFLVENKSSYLD